LGGEVACVEELGKDLLGGPMVGHVCKGDENGEEAEDVDDQDHAFESRKDFSSDTVDGDGECYNGPE
jgi:hypothetical protein